MPYSKNGKYYGSVTGRQLTKRQYQRRTRTVKATKYIAKGAHLAYKLARLSNVEMKHHDVDLTVGYTATATGSITDMNNIAQGQSKIQRIGDSIKPQSLTIRGVIEHNGLNTESQVRLILFKVKHPNGVLPTVAQLLEVSKVHSPKNYENRFHSKTIWDRTFSVDSSNRLKQFQKTFKLYGHINYTAGALTEESGAYILLTISDESTNFPVARWYSRMTYTDN